MTNANADIIAKHAENTSTCNLEFIGRLSIKWSNACDAARLCESGEARFNWNGNAMTVLFSG